MTKPFSSLAKELTPTAIKKPNMISMGVQTSVGHEGNGPVERQLPSPKRTKTFGCAPGLATSAVAGCPVKVNWEPRKPAQGFRLQRLGGTLVNRG